MNESAYQAVRTSVRTLKIEETGDFFHRDIKPKIRLTGRWLAKAGFSAGHRVEVTVVEPGTMTLRFIGNAPANL